MYRPHWDRFRDVVGDEQEQFAELVSSEFLLQNLKELLDEDQREQLENLPDGIHSGHCRQNAKGVFFYFTTRDKKRRPGKSEPWQETKRQHFWRYIDLTEGENHGAVEENRYLITNLIQC